jgi:hypothetical protein
MVARALDAASFCSPSPSLSQLFHLAPIAGAAAQVSSFFPSAASAPLGGRAEISIHAGRSV